MTLDYSLMLNALPSLLEGLFVTIQIATISYVLGISLGVTLGYLHTLKYFFIQKLVSVYVTIIRGTPMLVQITFFYYVLPTLGIELSPFWAATLAIAFNSGAYISQIIRSGINGVDQKQIEAAQVLGLSSFQIGRYIVIPQAIRIVFPSLQGEYITLLKDTSLASVIGVMELYKQSRAIMNRTYDVITVFFVLALCYLLLTFTAEIIFGYVQRAMKLQGHED